MAALPGTSVPLLDIRSIFIEPHETLLTKPPILNIKSNLMSNSIFFSRNTSNLKTFNSFSSSTTVSTDLETDRQEEVFDWYSEWYPVMPVCDLDKKVPHAKKVMGLDVVVWWDRSENEWKVFDDSCPHRLAPLSEGRIDQLGRLQCVYHGWCFNGFGDCKFIPQAPPDGPPVHTFNKACVAVYPSIVQHDIVWFWPDTDPSYKDIIMKKKPPFLPELDDPSFYKLMGNRDLPYGYEVLIENLMDPAHAPYAHYGVLRTQPPKEKADREGGGPLEMSVKELDVNGFIGKQEWGISKFMAPCVFYAEQDNGSTPPAATEKGSSAERKLAMILFCVPISPGKSRLIWAFPKNYGIWTDKSVPRWMFHVFDNLIVDSDLYLLHVEEQKIMEIGFPNWPKACFLPTKSDAYLVGFRRWLNKYAGGQVDWRGKYTGTLPPSPPREQLMDRYWSHVVNCKSCISAYKGLTALEIILQVVSLVSIGIVAAIKQNVMSTAARTRVVSMAVICFAASKLLAHFIYKNFHFHDYNHALR